MQRIYRGADFVQCLDPPRKRDPHPPCSRVSTAIIFPPRKFLHYLITVVIILSEIAKETRNINVKRESIKLLGKIGSPLSVEPLILA